MEYLTAIAHRRRAIERFHEDAKMELGPDHIEGRRWRCLNHHLTPVLIAHTSPILERLRRAREEAPGKRTPRFPTLGEVGRRVVFEVARALVSRAVLSRQKEARGGLGQSHREVLGRGRIAVLPQPRQVPSREVSDRALRRSHGGEAREWKRGVGKSPAPDRTGQTFLDEPGPQSGPAHLTR